MTSDRLKYVDLPGNGRVLCPSCVDRIERLPSGEILVHGAVKVDGKTVSVSTIGAEELLRYNSPVVAAMLRADLEAVAAVEVPRCLATSG